MVIMIITDVKKMGEKIKCYGYTFVKVEYFKLSVPVIL